VHRKLRGTAIVAVVCAFVTAGAAAQLDQERGVTELRHDYSVATDHIQKLIIASKLARAGDYSYWSFVRREAQRALRHDQPMLHWWQRLFGMRTMPRNPNSPNRFMAFALPDFEPQPDGSDRQVEEVSAYTLDVWRILAFASAAPKKEQDIELLRQAVHSPRPLIGAYAALGLARLSDTESAKSIYDAGRRLQPRESERLLFIEALVCLHTNDSGEMAKDLAGQNLEILQTLEDLAQRKHYDPYAEQ
jgi:hypothetical protein